jgi:hypothetical protein
MLEPCAAILTALLRAQLAMALPMALQQCPQGISGRT